MVDDYTDALVENIYNSIKDDTKKYLSTTCGLDVDNETFRIDDLINQVMANGGSLTIYDDAVDLFDETFKKIIENDQYNKDKGPDSNLIKKLNGVYFENLIYSICGDNFLKKNSTNVFSSAAKYDKGADFLAQSNKDTWRTFEAKNFIDLSSFSSARIHNALYCLVNNRKAGSINLFCKVSENKIKTYSQLEQKSFIKDSSSNTYKPIKLWSWLKPLITNYAKYRLDYSWQIERGIEEGHSKYVKFISPLLSKSK